MIDKRKTRPGKPGWGHPLKQMEEKAMLNKKALARRFTVGLAATAATTILSVMPAMAADNIPSSADTAPIVITGVEEDAEVYAYQVVEGVYNDFGLVGYQQTAESKAVRELADIEHISDLDVTTLAKWAYTLEDGKMIHLTYDKSAGTFSTTKALAGSYIVIVKKNYDDTKDAPGESKEATYVYNPMYVSNGYTDSNDKTTLGSVKTVEGIGEVGGKAVANAESTFDGKGGVVTRNTAYAKKTPVYIDKNIVGASTKELKWEDVAIGDTVTMEITSLTPDYSAAFSAGATKDQTDEDGHKLTSIYRITDNQSEGLDAVAAANILKVATYEMNGENRVETDIPADKYSFTFYDNDFYVDFDTDWLINHPASNIVIRYETKVNDKAPMAMGSTPNEVRLDYYTLPNGETDVLKDVVEYYTFRFDEAIKVVEGSNVYVDENGVKATKPLAGATFTLTRKGSADDKHDDSKTETKDKTYTVTTGKDGVILFEGLDEGVYTLKETAAPKGFLMIDKSWTVTIKAEYDGFEDKNGQDYRWDTNDKRDKAMKQYSVTIVDDDNPGVEVTSLYQPSKEVINGYGIVNQRISKLPSTGGKGVLIYTIGGAVLAIGGVATLFLAGKKKKQQD